MFELAPARLGAQGVRGDHEGEDVGALDPELDLPPPLDCRADVLAVDPDVLAVVGERFAQPLDELLVAARVGDEDVGHLGPPAFPPLFAPRARLKHPRRRPLNTTQRS